MKQEKNENRNKELESSTPKTPQQRLYDIVSSVRKEINNQPRYDFKGEDEINRSNAEVAYNIFDLEMQTYEAEKLLEKSFADSVSRPKPLQSDPAVMESILSLKEQESEANKNNNSTTLEPIPTLPEVAENIANLQSIIDEGKEIQRKSSGNNTEIDLSKFTASTFQYKPENPFKSRNSSVRGTNRREKKRGGMNNSL